MNAEIFAKIAQAQKKVELQESSCGSSVEDGRLPRGK